jgi:hypothetical protein
VSRLTKDARVNFSAKHFLSYNITLIKEIPMSVYTTVQASVSYASKRDFNRVVKYLEKGKWLPNDLIAIDENEQSINISWGYFRNFPFDILKKNSTGEIVWTCTDGTFFGGIIENEKEEKFDLNKWAKEHDISQKTFAKANDEDSTEFDWMQEVENAFHEEYSVIM